MILARLFPLETNLNFIGWRKAGAGLSAALLLVIIGLLIFRGLSFGIDFSGGVLIEMESEKPIDLAQIRSISDGLGLGEVVVQEFGNSQTVMVKLQVAEYTDTAVNAAADTVTQALDAGYPDKLEVRRTEFVGPTVGAELIEAGIIATVLSLIGVAGYLAFRFEWTYGLCAIAATIHDVLMVLGFYVVTGHDFSLTSIAAVMTVAGYSVNDTVVIFDRVREMLRKYKREPIPNVLNKSLNSTWSRTILTSMTTLLALISLYFFGGAVVQDFVAAMIVGVVTGTWSTIFIAVPGLMYFRLRPTETAEVADKASLAKPASR